MSSMMEKQQTLKQYFSEIPYHGKVDREELESFQFMAEWSPEEYVTRAGKMSRNQGFWLNELLAWQDKGQITLQFASYQIKIG